jgi:hypothetical protein
MRDCRRFWAVITRCQDGCYIGTVQDFYPAEERTHKAELLSSKNTYLLGTFDEGGQALAAVTQFIEKLCVRLNALPRRERFRRQQLRSVGVRLVEELRQ